MRFAEELADGSDTTEGQRKLSVLVKMIQEHGGKLSSHADKLFSSEEGTPDRVRVPQIGEREQVGLGMTARENLIQYLRKIGDHLSREVRKDKRYRESSEGAREFWGVATWEEAHEVVQEIEAMNAGQRALQNSSLSMGGPQEANSPEDSGGNRRRKKRNQQGQKNPEKSTLALALGANAKKKKVCFNMRDHGSCRNGDRCEHSHDKALVEAERKKRKEAEKAAKQSGDSAAAASSGKGKGKGKDKGGGNSKGGKGGGKGSQGKKQARRFWLTGRGCDKGARALTSTTRERGRDSLLRWPRLRKAQEYLECSWLPWKGPRDSVRHPIRRALPRSFALSRRAWTASHRGALSPLRSLTLWPGRRFRRRPRKRKNIIKRRASLKEVYRGSPEELRLTHVEDTSTRQRWTSWGGLSRVCWTPVQVATR